MTFQQVLEIIKSANKINQWPNEYYIYSPDGTSSRFAFVKCDDNGSATSFVKNINGDICILSAAEQQQIQSALNFRMKSLNIKSIYSDTNIRKI
jgi:hypothetical protein